MTPIDAFDDFWATIYSNEEFLKDYGHHPNSGWGDDTCRDLVDACNQVQPHLNLVSEKRMFDGPGDLRFAALNYHEALVLVLNPPHRWFRELWMLKSPQYLDLKAGARADENTVIEHQKVQSQSPNRSGKKSKRRKNATDSLSSLDRGDLFIETLLALLRNAHGCSIDQPFYEALTQEEISTLLKEQYLKRPSQAKVSRAMKNLMAMIPQQNGLSGMHKYRHLCHQREICSVLNELELRFNLSLGRTVKEAMFSRG